jgi:hypothetical protein
MGRIVISEHTLSQLGFQIAIIVFLDRVRVKLKTRIGLLFAKVYDEELGLSNQLKTQTQANT